MAFRTNKTPVLQEKSASGSVATFNTALAMPLSSCNIAVNAWQEGTGDPYPAGGSAQIWDEEWELGIIDIQTGNKVSSSTRIRTKNFIPILPNTTYYKVSPTTGFRWVIFYNSAKQYLGYLNTSGTGSFTTPNDAYYMKSYTESDSYGTSYKNDISINYPATDTTYHPYSNIRPIHGFSEVNAYQRAVNLWDEQWEQGAINTSGGINKFETSRRTTSFIAVVPNTTYRQVSPQSAYGGRIAYYDENQTLLLYNGNGVSGGTKTFTTPANCRYVRITIGSVYGTTYNNDISINYPSTDTDYHAYNGNTYTIQLGQEVYGAEVDVVNGVAHVTWTAVDMANLTWTSAVVEDFIRWRCVEIRNYNGQSLYSIPTNVMVEQFKLTSFSGQLHVEGVGKFCIMNGNMYACTADINTKPQGLLAYELTEPFDIQLTPTQIETLIGNNTIFADTGDVDLTYKDLDIAKRGNFREVFKLPS